MHKLIFGLAACTLWAMTYGPVLAASGRALGVDPAAEARRPAETLVLTVGADIFIGDRVVTGASGQVQIKFDDNTELVVGPSSALLIEDYLLREDGSAGKLALNALAGTFRFVTGGAPKGRYSIKTPTGTIGVRGTAFELYVTQLWSYIMMQDGSVIVRNNGDKSMVLEAVCEVGQFSLGEAIIVGPAGEVSNEDRARLRRFFMYAANQRSLLREFRIPNAERCLRQTTGGQGGGSLTEPGEGGTPTTPTTPTPPPVILLKRGP